MEPVDTVAAAFRLEYGRVLASVVRIVRDIDAAEEIVQDELAARLPAVLAVLSLIFNEGYAAHAGETLVRHDLCEDAIRLGELLAALMPGEPEMLGLIDRTGSYQLQAAIAACHAGAPSWDATDWPAIVAHYDALAAVAPSPVVARTGRSPEVWPMARPLDWPRSTPSRHRRFAATICCRAPARTAFYAERLAALGVSRREYACPGPPPAAPPRAPACPDGGPRP